MHVPSLRVATFIFSKDFQYLFFLSAFSLCFGSFSPPFRQYVVRFSISFILPLILQTLRSALVSLFRILPSLEHRFTFLKHLIQLRGFYPYRVSSEPRCHNTLKSVFPVKCTFWYPFLFYHQCSPTFIWQAKDESVDRHAIQFITSAGIAK